MADNYITNPGAGGITFAGDEDGALVQWPLIKLAWGPLDTFNILADAPTKRLPINLAECGITLSVSAAALPLPAGAATSAKQDAIIAALGSPLQAGGNVSIVGSVEVVNDVGNPLPVNGTVTANLGTVAGLLLDATFTTRVNTQGQKAMAASTPVVLASDQAAIPVTVSGNVEVTNDVGNPLPVSGTVTTSPPANASTNLSQVGGVAISEGQKAMAASLPVVIASDQSAVPVSGTVAVSNFPASVEVSNDAGNPLPVNGTVTASQGGAPWQENLTQVGGAAVSLGAKTSAASIPVVLATDEATLPVSIAGTVAVTGALTDTQLRASPVPVTGSLSIAASTLPTLIEDNGAAYDDNGAQFVALHPDSDPATGSAQEFQRALLALIAAAQPPAQQIVTGTLGFNGDAIGPLKLNGATRVTCMASGTYGAATLTFEVANDAGPSSNWVGVRTTRFSNLFPETGSTAALTANLTQGNVADVAGWAYYRVRCTAYVSGTIQISLSASYPGAPLIHPVMAVGSAAEGQNATSTPVRIGAWDGTVIRTPLADATGQLQVVTTAAALPPNAATESGNLATLVSSISALNTAIAQLTDTVRQVATLQRVNNMLVSQLNQASTDDPLALQHDFQADQLN